MKLFKLAQFIYPFFLIFLIGCGGGSGNTTNTEQNNTNGGGITVVNQKPTVSIALNGTLKVGHEVELVVNATDSDGEVKKVEVSGDFNSNHQRKTFTKAGQKSVTVKVTDDDGATATSTKSFTIMANQKPTVSIALNGTLKVGHELELVVNATDSDGSVAKVEVSGDFNSNHQRKTFTKAGQKSVTVKVTDDDGATTTATKNFTIAEADNVPPSVSLEVQGDMKVNHPITIKANASDSDGEIVSYKFSGDISGNTKNITKKFTTPGVKTLVVEVTDNRGAKARATKKITIMANQKPTVNININGTLKVGHELELVINAIDSDGSVAKVEVSGAFDSNHQRKTFQPGDYSVTVKVTDDDGAITTKTKNFTIEDLTNQEKIDRFEEGKSLVEIMTGVKLPQSLITVLPERVIDQNRTHRHHAYFNGNEMEVVEGGSCEYNFQDGLFSTMKGDSGELASWEWVKYHDLQDRDYTFSKLNYCSYGLYDEELYNFGIDEWVSYNYITYFGLHDNEEYHEGLKYVTWGRAYTKAWPDHFEYHRESAPVNGIVYYFGQNGYYNTMLGYYKIDKTFLKDYSLEADNHFGLPEGTLLHNCVSSVNDLALNEGPNGEMGVRLKSVVCENYGLVKLSHEYFDDTELASIAAGLR